MDPGDFCERIGGKAARWNVIERTELTWTVLHGRQFAVGQWVVLPVRHAPTLRDLPEREDAAVMAAAQRLTHAMVRAFAPDGVLLYQNNGVGSGQEVPHFHLHVVLRRADSAWGVGPPHIARLEYGPRLACFDQVIVADTKRQTVEPLRRYYR